MLSKQYIAGFFDGEGCVNLYRTKSGCAVKVLIVNTNRSVLESIQTRYGGDINTGRNHNKNKSWKKSYTWRISWGKAVLFLKDIFPYVVIKEQQILTAITWAAAAPGKGQRWDKGSVDLLCERMAWLNKKGFQKRKTIDPAIRVMWEMHEELMEAENASKCTTN